MHLHDTNGFSSIKSLITSTFSKDKGFPALGKSDIVSQIFLN